MLIRLAKYTRLDETASTRASWRPERLAAYLSTNGLIGTRAVLQNMELVLSVLSWRLAGCRSIHAGVCLRK